jgi:hypothetical protein
VDGLDTLSDTRGTIEIEYSSIRMLRWAGLFLPLTGQCAVCGRAALPDLPFWGEALLSSLLLPGQCFSLELLRSSWVFTTGAIPK